MDYDDMLHKIVPGHSDALRRMLAVNEVPEIVLIRYFAVKKYLDKICGDIRAIDLLRMAMDCGFNLETGKFRTKLEETYDVQERPRMAEPEATQETVDEIIEEANLETADEETGVDPNAETAVEEVIESNTPIENGTQVTFYLEGDPNTATIKDHKISEGTGELTYMVEFEGETVEISEDDIEK